MDAIIYPMKIEICEETRIMIVLCVLVVAVVFGVTFCVDAYNKRVVAAFASGYEEAPVPGTQNVSTGWRKK